MKGLHSFICSTKCPRCGKDSRIVVRRRAPQGRVEAQRQVLQEECMACKLTPLQPQQRNYFIHQWRELWRQAGGKLEDMPEILRPEELAPPWKPPPRRAAPPPPPRPAVDDAGARPGMPVAAQIPVPPPPSPRPLNVLVASHCLELSGAPIILANLLPHLRGMNCRVYAPDRGPLRLRFREAGIPVTHTLDLGGVDLVVANTTLSAPAVEAARQAGVPCVWMIHEQDPTMTGNLDVVKDLLHYPRAVIFPHPSTAASYREWRSDGVHIVPSIVPPPPLRDRAHARRALAIQPGEFIAVTFGRNEPRKGQDDLRQAAAGLPMMVYAIHSSDDHWDWLAAADVYVCCSRVEAFPLSLQEAKAYGLPVITTPLPGCTSIVMDGVHGLYYEPGNVAQLRRHLEALIGDLAFRRQLGRPVTHLPTFGESVAAYEGLFRSAAGMGHDAPLHVVYHIAGMGALWPGIVAEQLQALADAGLTRVLCTHVGDGLEYCLDHARRLGIELVVCDHRERLDHYERPAIELIERLVRNSDLPVLYLHSKGVSHEDPKAMYHPWRRLMMKALVSRWREHLPALLDHDAVGVDWWSPSHVNHFSGNFWLATAAWLRQLPPIASTWNDRYAAERHIGRKPGCRAKSLLCSDAAFWSRDRGLFEQLVREELGEDHLCAIVYD